MNQQYSQAIRHPRILFLFCFLLFCFGIWMTLGNSPLWGILLFWGISIGIISCWYPLNIWTLSLLIFSFIGGYGISGHENEKSLQELEYITKITENFSGTFTIVGTVEKNLYNTDNIRAYRLNIETIATEKKNEKITEYTNTNKNFWLLLEIPRNLSLTPWDTIQFSSKITPLIEFPIQDFARYAWGNKLFGKVKPWQYTFMARWKETFREKTQDTIRNIMHEWFPKQIAGILLWVTFGNIDLLDQGTKNTFRDSGLTHILVVSGSNIALVLIILSWIFRYIPIPDIIKWAIIIFFLLVYTTIVGWETPVIRATFMGILGYLSLQAGNKLNSISILVLVGWIFLMIKPSLLINDASFGLSFAATLGILTFYPIFERIMRKLPFPDILISIFWVTFAATLGSLPVVLYHFWSFPLGSIFANLLIAGIVGILLIWSVLYLVAFFLFPPNILYFLWIPLYLLTSYTVYISEFFGSQFGRIDFSGKFGQILILLGISFLFFFTVRQESEKLLLRKSE